MKKYLMVVLLVFASVFAFAVPNGCYQGTSRHTRGRCALLIQGDVLHVINRDGDVIARWNIISEKDGRLSLKSEYGATNSASWWVEDGQVYLNFNYEKYIPY